MNTTYFRFLDKRRSEMAASSAFVSLPARIKTGTNYQVGRLARIEGRALGCSDMVLLNQWGRVAETTGACILMVRDGVVYTPPATEGALESITLDLVEALAKSMKIPFVAGPSIAQNYLLPTRLPYVELWLSCRSLNRLKGSRYPKVPVY